MRFTGVELATFRVAPDEAASEQTLHREAERRAGALAVVALLGALAGLGLDLVRRAGGGVCAVVGLVAMQVLGGAIMSTGAGSGGVERGYWLALLGFALAGLLHLALALRRRRDAGVPGWSYAIPLILLAVLPTLLFAALVAVALTSEQSF